MSPSVWIPLHKEPESISSPLSDVAYDEEEVNVRVRPYWPAYRNLLKIRSDIRLETVGDAKQYYKELQIMPALDPFFHPFLDLEDDALCPDAGLPDNLFRGTRNSDGMKVVVKAVHVRSRELGIVRFFSIPPIKDHPMNHCIPILDIVQDGEVAFIVMEQWSSQLVPDNEGPCCFKLFLSAVRQCIEHAAFMHAHRIAHLDISMRNLLTDYHGNYAYIDYELSRQFEEPIPRTCTSDWGRMGTEIPPECNSSRPFDPFKVDVFALGVLILRAYKLSGHVFPELLEIVRPMLRDIPDERPSLEDVVISYKETIERIPKDRLEYCHNSA